MNFINKIKEIAGREETVWANPKDYQNFITSGPYSDFEVSAELHLLRKGIVGWVKKDVVDLISVGLNKNIPKGKMLVTKNYITSQELFYDIEEA